jgi:fibronectin-binding autotransporter adhesin
MPKNLITCIRLFPIFKIFFTLFLLLSGFFFVSASQVYAYNCTSQATGNFNAAATWTSCNSTTPQTTDTITISAGNTVTLVASTTVAGITVNSNATLAANTRAVTDSGNFIDNGSVTGTTSTLALSGSGATIDGSGTYSPTGTITVTNNKTINSTANLSFPGALTISSGTTTNNGTISVSGNLTGSGGWTQGTNSTLFAGGGTTSAMSVTTVDFTTNTPNTVDYNRAGNQTAKVANYDNLTIDGSGTKTLTSITTVNGDFTANAGTATVPLASVGGNFIAAGATLTLATNALEVSGNLSVSAGTLTTGAVAFTVDGTTEVSGGTLTFTSNTGAKTMTGLVTVDGGTMNGASTNIIFLNGITQTSGTVAITGTATFNTNDQTLSGTLAIATITCGTGVTVINSGAVTSSGTVFTLTGNWTQGTGSTLTFSGAITFSGSGTFDASTNSNTVVYNRSGNQTLDPINYSYLTIGGSGTKTMTGITTVNNDFTANAGTATVPLASVGGNFIAAGATLTLATNALEVSGNLSVSAGTLTTGGVAFTVDGTTEVSGGTFTFTNNTGAKTMTGLVTVDGGTMNGASTNIVFENGINQTSGTVSITGTATFSTNNQELDGTQAITTIVIGSGITVTNNGSITASGTSFTLTGNWTQGVSSTLTFSGSITFSGSGTFDAATNTNTVVYSRSGAQTCLSTQYDYLQFAGSGAKTCAPTAPILNDVTIGGTATWTMTTAVTIDGNLTINGGTITGAAYAFTLDGTTDIESGTLALNNNTGTKLLTGMVTLNGGTLSGSSNNIQLGTGITNNGGTVSITGTVTIASSGFTFSGANTITITTLTVNSPGAVTNNGTVTINGTFSGSGSWTQGASSELYLGGSGTNALAISTFDASTNANTVDFDSTNANQTVNGITYNNLTIDKLGETATLGGNISVTGDLTILNGTLNTSSANSYSIEVQGDWSNSDTFVPNYGTVTFDGSGDQMINNPNTWYGLTITGGDRTVYFESTVAQSIAAGGALIMQGTAGHLLTLAPSVAGSTWQLDVAGSGNIQSVSYVAVSYSDASSGWPIDASDGTDVDNGNNLNWTILISIELDDSSTVNMGTVALGATQDTTPSGTNDGRVITVDYGPVALHIKSTAFSDGGGDTWTLGSSNGTNQVKWEFSEDGSTWSTFTSPDPTYFTLDPDVAQGDNRNIYFRLTMPTVVNTLDDHSSTVTILATAP